MLFTGVLVALATVSFVSATPYGYQPRKSSYVNQTTCNGKTYTYEKLAGYGYIPSNARDTFGDTLGGFGSSIALDRRSWRRKGKSYCGILWGLPDRGWNTEGTLNYQARVHKFEITLTPDEGATVANPSKPNLQIKYLTSIGFTDPKGTPTTGLDPTADGAAHFDGFPDLPTAVYTGDGFGGSGPGGRRVSIDAEGLVLNDDGTFWVSDEYGPYIYHFSSSGKMLQAIRPPEAYIPHRNRSESFSAASPPRYDPDAVVIPEDPESGRQNNQGFEGLTISPDGKTLSVLIQSALEQEGGMDSSTRRLARFAQYNLPRPASWLKYWGKKTPRALIYKAEYVVPLPTFKNAKGNTKVAAQSEIHYISPTQFLVLARDSGAGHGQDSSLSLYRHADVFDISRATNVKSTGDNNDAVDGSIASGAGVLDAGISAAQYCPWLDYNVNAQLGRFGLRNGGAQDAGLLNEKWESLALAPVDPSRFGMSFPYGLFGGYGLGGYGGGGGEGDEYYLFSISDNDFITQDGAMDGGKLPYADESGFNLDNQVLVFKVRLPKGAMPLL